MKSSLAAISLSLAMIIYSAPAEAQDENSDRQTQASMNRAAMVSLAPLRIEMDGEKRAETLRVFNPSSRAIGVQLRPFGWHQENGQDAYSATNEVMVSPSITTIAPGATQIFRVMRRDLPSAGERRYRLAVDQLPDPELLAAGEAQARIRFTIPMFVDRAKAAPAQLEWRVDSEGLKAFNRGEQTARMVNMSLTDAAGQAIALDGASLHYVQGGSTLVWPLIGACPAGPVHFTASIDGEMVDVQPQNAC